MFFMLTCMSLKFGSAIEDETAIYKCRDIVVILGRMAMNKTGMFSFQLNKKNGHWLSASVPSTGTSLPFSICHLSSIIRMSIH